MRCTALTPPKKQVGRRPHVDRARSPRRAGRRSARPAACGSTCSPSVVGVDPRAGHRLRPGTARRPRCASAPRPSTSGSAPTRRSPAPRTPPSGATRIDGLIIEPIRWPGGVAWNPSGLRSASPSMLFSWIPVPGTTKPEVTPLEVVIEATIPSAVDRADSGWSRRGQRGGRRRCGGAIGGRRRGSPRSPIHPRASSGSNGGAAPRVSAMIEPPNDGGGLVKNWWPARSATTGSPVDHLVARRGRPR